MTLLPTRDRICPGTPASRNGAGWIVGLILALSALVAPPLSPALALRGPAALAPPASPGPAAGAAPVRDGPNSEECTIAVVTGTGTPDGRPLLWKNRDSGYQNNEVVYFDDGRLPYVALVSAGEIDKAWIGVNERGFAVMNALSYNLPDYMSGGITNGALMKLALQTCRNVAAFESLLVVTSESGRENPANLAVIDAAGGAAMFEVGSFSFVKFDATDRDAAPNGIVVRANFSLSADTTGLDTWRFRRAQALILENVGARSVDVRWLLRVARDLRSPTVDPYPLPHEGAPPEDPDAIGYINAGGTINRRSSVAAGVIQGVLPGEDPRLSTFFAVPGQPVVTIAVPVWVAAGPTPWVVDGPLTSPLCDLALQRTAQCYDHPRYGSWLNTSRLLHRNIDRNSFAVRVNHAELWLLPETESRLEQWRHGGISASEMAAVELDLAQRAFEDYRGPNAEGPEAGPGEAASPSQVGGPLLTCTPNPTRGATTITYELNQERAPGWNVEIFDSSGRLVTRLAPDNVHTHPAGENGPGGLGHLRWDGRSSEGAPVASGVYFCRPGGSNGAVGRALVVVR